ncbi:MAG: dihydrolipoyl dehydrogenase [Deltaproteobacteria bacterium]|nr:MAG: dihydrolipoyl dehydrogenase [Deltaproteobacteria bacterium]
MKTYDAIVIGSGPGGYPCAIRLGQLKQKTLCIEKDKPGGVCLNWGCIPSKALIHASHQFEKATEGAEVGVKVGDVSFDVDAMQDWKDGIVTKLNKGVRALLKGAGVDYQAGAAKLTGPDTVEVTGSDGSTETFRAEKGIVIATGAAPINLPTFKPDGTRIIGAKEALSLRAVPKRLMVIGGGAIGVELGTVYQKLGSELTLVEALPDLLTGVDSQCVRLVERKIKKHGGKILKKTFAKGYEQKADGSLEVTLDKGGDLQTVNVDVVLVAIGMRSSTAELGLESAAVALDERGFVTIDERGRTNVETIYAIGDVTGPPLLAHRASTQGEAVAEIIAGHDVTIDLSVMAAVVFSDPEIAGVGLTEQSAKDQEMDVKIGKFPFMALGKAMAMRETDGFVKIIADAKTDRVLGVHIVGPEAGAMISEAALTIKLGATTADVADTIHPHPTLGEAYMEAAANALGRAIHIPNR